MLDLLLELLIALGREDHFLHGAASSEKKTRGAQAPSRASMVPMTVVNVKLLSRGYDLPPVQVDLRESWPIGPVEIPTRLVLAPMAGVSVQAFRRQGRRFGAGLVCSEMVSCAGLSHGNERTLGYLRIAADEHPLAVQIFGSEPEVMAEAARMVEDAGADLVDVNFGCPVRKVTKTGAGATLLEEPDRACRIVQSVANAVAVPVSVKMRRGLDNGSRAALAVGPKLVDAGAASLTLHTHAPGQMSNRTDDQEVTAAMVAVVYVPVKASGEVKIG